ncbi:unnamed protein product [Gongylonema pulchrum]|uniref:Uncharacterized protein n=1 Tax=Gongylonema pulchrum TaxID=637853 RepID=A0A183EPD8_9BILA|nr:unnamed protein product [Gongylonema pulchrum]
MTTGLLTEVPAGRANSNGDDPNNYADINEPKDWMSEKTEASSETALENSNENVTFTEDSGNVGSDDDSERSLEYSCCTCKSGTLSGCLFFELNSRQFFDSK